MNQIEIRQGTTADLNELELLYDKVTEALETGVNYPGWTRGIYPAREDAEHGLNLNCLYVAHHEGRLVGTVILSHEAEPAYGNGEWKISADAAELLVIHTLATHPEYRNLGVGKCLMDFAENLGREMGMKAIRLDVTAGNDPAIRLYERCGYQYAGTVDLGLGEFGQPWFKLYEKVLV